MKLLIAIHGAHSQPEHMAAQRETWLADLQGADYKYFLGQPEWAIGDAAYFRSGDTDVITVDSPDGPIWEGHRRTWHSNRKTEALARYALEDGYDYVFKCDDDTYVYVDRLLASGFEAHDYCGNLDKHHAQDVGWYRWAQGGAGYWLSRRAMEVIAANGLHRVRAEDFAVGQLLAAHGFAAYHDPRYIPGATEQELRDPTSEVITLHKVSPNWMRAIHNLKGEK